MISLAVAILAVGLWLGALVFQSAFVAPTLFSQVPVETASGFLRTLFPRYYALGIGCSAVLTAALVTAGSSLGWSAVLTWQVIGAVVMLVAAAASALMVPSINAARDADSPRFDTLHHTAVGLNVLMLVLALAITAAFGFLPGSVA